MARVCEDVEISGAFPAFIADQVTGVGIGFPLAVLLICFLTESACFKVETVTESSIQSSSRSAVETSLT